jgi:hypothetical protein
MRQLNLFKGKRQRGVKPPSPLEFTIHVMLADLLTRWSNPQWEWTHLPFGEKRNIVTAGRLKRMGVRPGWPDFLFAGPNAKLVWLELKREGNTPSDEQEKILDHLRICGFEFLVTDSFDEAVAYLKRLEILPVKIGV